jgi:hypothetical protein
MTREIKPPISADKLNAQLRGKYAEGVCLTGSLLEFYEGRGQYEGSGQADEPYLTLSWHGHTT